MMGLVLNARGPTPTRCGSTRYRSLAAAAGAFIMERAEDAVELDV